MHPHHTVRLRQFDQSDFTRLIGWIDSFEGLVLWAGPTQFRFPLTIDQLQAYASESEGEKFRRKIFTATDLEGNPVGHIEVGAIDWQNESGTLCRVLVSPVERGRGLSLPMVLAALRYGFEDLHLRRIDLRVYAHNDPAIRCYEKAGFVREGYLRKAQKVGESFWDAVTMSILREEWVTGAGSGLP